MPYPAYKALSTKPALTDEATLEASLECISENLTLEMEGAYSCETLFEILLHAASKHQSLEQTTQELEGTPTSNTIRYHLDKFEDMETLEQQLNDALQSRLPSKIAKRKHRVAIDLHLIPYYGKPSAVEEPYIYHSHAKAGTTRFFAYATLYVICRHKRVTLAIHAVPRNESLVKTLEILRAALSRVRVGVKRLLLDRGFYNVAVIRYLKTLNIPFLMPAVIRGKQKGTRSLLTGRSSYRTAYTLNSPKYGSVTCQMAVICRYQKGHRGKRGLDYLLYVVHRINVALHSLHQYYRERFGIETSYRIKNLCRIRTTTKNPVVRLLFVALSFVLVNLWVYLLWKFVYLPRHGARQVYQSLLPLKTMLHFLSHAIERFFPPITSVFLPALE
jgi:hypothetical protein